MIIRHATLDDLDRMMEIYSHARKFMADNGNPRQWGGTNWPPKALLEKDIELERSYVCEENGSVIATFCYIYGEDDPTYQKIEDGAWKDDSPYGVVHRIATDHSVKGTGSYCLNWAFDQCGHLRIDTHGDNKVMQNLLKKLGFDYCGIIYVEEDNDPRVAYEKTNK